MTRSKLARGALIAFTIIPSLVLVACGGGSSGGSDSSYVAAICAAEKKLEDSLTTAMQDPSLLANPAALGDKLAPAFDQFAKDFAKANPPSDAKAWHDSTAKQFADLATSLKTGQDLQSVMSGSAATIPDPPAAINARWAKVAATNKDCQATGAFNP